MSTRYDKSKLDTTSLDKCQHKNDESKLDTTSLDKSGHETTSIDTTAVIVELAESVSSVALSFHFPSRFPWSYVPTQLWTCPPCTFDWTHRLVHISSLELSCSNHSICQPLHEVRSTEHAPQPAHTLCSLRSWTSRHDLGYLGMIWRSTHHDWLDVPWKNWKVILVTISTITSK